MDVGELGRACVHEWFNQSLCLVNDSVIRMGVFRGEFHWHHHEREDEFFFVLEGCLLVDFRDRTVALQRHQGIVVPHCVEHRTRAEMRTVVLMVEPATIVPVGQSTAPPHA
ncbi:MAG: hypothetical protein HJJLKODD_02415 [Phycisphaerae bacterium]|nr:hypothetical protein [Phycisphaerae bacterium]